MLDLIKEYQNEVKLFRFFKNETKSMYHYQLYNTSCWSSELNPIKYI